MNNELIERIDGAYFGFCSEKTETLVMDCKAEIERLTLANETLSALNVEYLERVKLLEAEAWRESKAREYVPFERTELANAIGFLGISDYEYHLAKKIQNAIIQRANLTVKGSNNE